MKKPADSTPTPSADQGPNGPNTVRCSQCGPVEPDHEGRCPSPNCKRALPGNSIARKHGARALETGHGTALDKARQQEIERAVLEDLGGEDECSEVRRQLVADFAFAAVMRLRLAEHLAAVGPLTPKGRRRPATDLWATVSGRVESLAVKVGLDRRSRSVDVARQLSGLESHR